MHNDRVFTKPVRPPLPNAMALSPVRKVLIAVGVIVALAAGTLVYLATTFDANAYKGHAIDWMKTHRDRTLTIDGPVELSFFPKLSVKLSGVTLSERGRADEFAHVDRLSLSVATWPLLSRRLQVDAVDASGIRLAYLRNPQGVANIDDLLDPPDPATPPPPDAPAKPLTFDVDGIRVENLALTVRDDLAKWRGKLVVSSFTTGRLADGVASPIELDAQVALTEPAVTGRLAGKTRLQFALQSGAVSLQQMALNWTGDAFGVRGLSTTVTGALSYDRTAGTVSADDLDARLGASVGDLKLIDSRVRVAKFAYDPARKLVSLNALAVQLAGTQGAHPFSLGVDWPTLTVTGDALTGSALSGSVSMKGPTTVDATFRSAAPRGNFERIEVPALALTLKGRSGPRTLAGTVQSDLRIDVAKQSATFEAFAARLGIEEPSLQALAIVADGRLAVSPTAANWVLKGDINRNAFDTEGRAGLADRPVSVAASANFKSLDLNRLLPAAAPAPASSARPASGSGDAAPVDLSVLRALQGSLRLTAGQLAVRQYRASQVTATVTLAGGVLRAGPLRAGLWGGRVDATATADAATRRIAVNATAEGVDVGALLKDVADKDLLEGTGRVTADLAGQGGTVGALKSSLQGTAALLLKDGAIKGVNLAKQLRQARAALSMRSDAGTTAVQTEKTDFSELSASFKVASGTARSDDLSMKSPFLRLGGAGAVDIPASRIDYTVRATVAETSKGQGGAELADLRGVTVPVQLTGPLDAIAWNIRWSAVAADLLKSQAGRQVEERLREKLGEQLGLPPRPASAPAGTGAQPRDVLKERLRGLLK